MNIKIKNITSDDLLIADVIVQSAFELNESRLTDLQRYHKMQPDGWFMALLDDQPVGTIGAIILGNYAYIGMMAVQKEFQRRGIASVLMKFILNWIEEKNICLPLLDASSSGRPLYLKLGFQEIEETHLYTFNKDIELIKSTNIVYPIADIDFNELVEYDKSIFKSDRSKLYSIMLKDFSSRGYVSKNTNNEITGLILVQNKRIGPFIANNKEDAETLFTNALALPFNKIPEIIIPDSNKDAMLLVEKYGFVKSLTNVHMKYGDEPLLHKRKFIYGQTSFATG